MLKLAIVIVSYNVASLLQDCLRSVVASAAESRAWLDVQVIVVDNASSDGSAAMVAAEFPNVQLIASDMNLGFTGGNNLALHSLGFSDASAASLSSGQPDTPDFVLLLNPDTLVLGDTLGKMAAFLRDHPQAGAVGAHLRYGDGRFQHGAFRFPGLTQVVLDLYPWAEIPGVRRLWPRLLDSRLNGRYPNSLWAGDAAFPVDFVLGAGLLVRAEAIRQVGLLDDSYFMYCEEMDWCLRFQEAAWPVYALPTAHIIHLEGQSSRQVRWNAFERLWRSRFHFYQKQRVHYSDTFLFFLRLFVRVGLWIRAMLARRKFADGLLSGVLLDRELAAYREIGQL